MSDDAVFASIIHRGMARRTEIAHAVERATYGNLKEAQDLLLIYDVFRVQALTAYVNVWNSLNSEDPNKRAFPADALVTDLITTSVRTEMLDFLRRFEQLVRSANPPAVVDLLFPGTVGDGTLNTRTGEIRRPEEPSYGG